MTDGSCSLRDINSRSLGFEYVTGTLLCGVGGVILEHVGSEWPLVLCRVESCPTGSTLFPRSSSWTASCSASSALPTDWSSSAHSRTTAVELAVTLYVTRVGCDCAQSCRIPCTPPVSLT